MIVPAISALALIAQVLAAAAPQAGGTEIVAPPAPDADALAAEMRTLADDPENVAALLNAGELTLKLGDPTAAERFFARAERIDPRSGRARAGSAATLVAMERPGEALRRFAEAEALGENPRRFAAHRGLAYDLVGDQVRAQRDYRLALQQDRDDETVRRLALSLAILGRRDEALAQLDAQLRRSDRAAWRSRAFVLALDGDDAGAEKIASSMLPAGMASGMQAFFKRLPMLSPTDRAFAVHFGELRATPERIADAALAPRLPRLKPDPLPDAPTPTRVASSALAPTAPVRARGAVARRARSKQPPAVQITAAPAPALPTPEPLPPPPRMIEPPALVMVQPLPADVPLPSPKRSSRRRAAEVAAVADANRAVQGGPVAPVETRPAPAATPTIVAPPPVKTPPRQVAQRVAPVRSEASILASIIATIEVPDAELASAPAPATGPAIEFKPRPTRKAAAVDPTDAKLPPGKPAPDKKRDKKAKGAKAEPAKPDPAKTNPVRIWVQVAGGANVADLPKAWAALKAKTPLLKGKTAWSTPLRATNRLLTGPFDSAGEAQSFVNQIAREGLSGFVFTSDAGQKIDRLPAE